MEHVWGGEQSGLPQRQALAHLRLRSHWGAEETMLLEGVSERARRVCPHCEGEVETAEHMALRCPDYSE